MKIGVTLGSYGHSKSSAMSPFDRGHTTFYLSFIDTTCLFCTVFEVVNYLSIVSSIFPIPRVFGASVGVLSLEFRQCFWLQKAWDLRLSRGVVSLVICFAVVLLHFQCLQFQSTACGHCTVQWLAVLEWPLLVSFWTRPLSQLSTSVITDSTRTQTGCLSHWFCYFLICCLCCRVFN